MRIHAKAPRLEKIVWGTNTQFFPFLTVGFVRQKDIDAELGQPTMSLEALLLPLWWHHKT
jgi:hypothetical protein